MFDFIKRIFKREPRETYFPLPIHRAITHNSIVLKGLDLQYDLPFEPCMDEVIFSEDGYDEATNAYIREHYDRIVERFAQAGLRFTYLPYVGRDLDCDTATWRYLQPYGEPTPATATVTLTSDYLLGFMMRPQNRPLVGAPRLLRYSILDNFTPDAPPCRVFAQVPFDITDINDFEEYFADMIECITREVIVVRHSPATPPSADEGFDSETRNLLDEARTLINRLMHKGVSEVALAQLLIPQPKLSRLLITPDNRILLPDYDDMEIAMTPLVKAVYFLFLRHPEGIAFKQLADYREELAQIYDNIKGGAPATRTLLGKRKYDKSIIALTDPLDNSINEKCARIKEAFLTRFHGSMAQHYYVTGKRGEPKHITLTPTLITWQSAE